MEKLPYQFLEREVAKLAYVDIGEGTPLLLVHGLGLDLRMWTAQMNYFQSKYRVIAYDVRGFGKSAFGGDPQAHLAIEDLKALVDHLALEKIYLVGLSMGGNIVISFAAHYPELVEKLVVVDGDIQGFDNYTLEFKGLLKSVFEMGKSKGPLAAKLAWARNELLQPYQLSEATRLLEVMLKEYSGLHLTDPKLLPGTNPPSLTMLDKVQSPTLIVVGEKDIVDFHRMADQAVSQIAQARKVEIPACGHMPPLERPPEFNKVLTEFLNETI
ncbi:MAG: alpha/beta hydrolase [Bacteroidota bacterium]